MTYIVLQKSGQTRANKYVEEDNISDYNLKLLGTTVEAFTSVIYTALSEDNVQTFM